MAQDLPKYEDNQRLSLPQAFLLLSLKEKEGTLLADTVRAQHGLAGAILAELALAEVIKLKEDPLIRDRVHALKVFAPKDKEPGFPLTIVCANALAQIRRAKHNQSATDWVSDLAPAGLRHRVAEPLLRAKVLTRKRRLILGIIPVTSYPEVNPAVELELRRFLLDRVNNKNLSVSASILIALLQATGLLRKVLGTYSPEHIQRIVADTELPVVVQEAVQACYFATVASITTTGTDLS